MSKRKARVLALQSPHTLRKSSRWIHIQLHHLSSINLVARTGQAVLTLEDD